MAAETQQIAAWLESTLKGDATLAGLVAERVHEGQVPQRALQSEVRLPAIVYSFQGGNDVSSLESVRGVGSRTLLVKAIGEGSDYAAVSSIMDRVDTLLQGAQVDLSSAARLCITRQSEVRYPESDGGRQYRHLGGIYALLYGSVT